jgi:6-pyruvoyltetrahydropterin/6-carboxytetrahydropterin synthase
MTTLYSNLPTCTRRLEFDSGHRVPGHRGKCKNLHGHRYVAEITCQAIEELLPEGFVIDFSVIKQKVGTWIDDNLDHTVIYQSSDWFMHSLALQAKDEGHKPWYPMNDPPTAENIAVLLHATACSLLLEDCVRVTSVRVWETPNCFAHYQPDV